MGWTPTPEQRAALIRARELAHEMRGDGATWKAVTDRLTADGYPTMHGTAWTYQMVQRLARTRRRPNARRRTAPVTGGTGTGAARRSC